jgi:uncharacterized protein YebE (UPF0316 family)
MDIEGLKQIVNAGGLDVEYRVIDFLAKDKDVIPLVMKILDRERQLNKELRDDMNVLLSKAHMGLDNKRLNQGGFIQKEIIEFYTKYKDKIGHCFKNLFEEKI